MRRDSNIEKYCDKETVFANKCLNILFMSKAERRSYIGLEMLAVGMIFLLCGIVYVVTYKTNFKDPLENIKKLFFNAQLIAMLVSLAITACAIMGLKTSKKLILILKLLVIANMIIMLIFTAVKSSWDKIYVTQWFSEYYDENKNDTKEEVELEVKIADRKEKFVSDNVSAYQYFGVKSIFCIIVYGLIELLEIYLMFRYAQIERNRAQLKKDDIVVYDEEENIKM